MTTPSIIEAGTVRLDADLGADKAAVIAALARTLVDNGRAGDLEQLLSDLNAREAKSATGMPGGIAIPHCKSAAVITPSLGFARLTEPVDFGAKDGPSDLVFLIAAPDGSGKQHLAVLSTLARNLVRKEFVAGLRGAATTEEAVEIIRGVLAPEEPTAATAAARPDAESGTGDRGQGGEALRLVAVTACPTGIAHTYMAADSLAQAARDKGVDLVVETQGSSASTPVEQEVIDRADAVIFATDVGVRDRGRFAGKPVVESGVKRAISEPEVMLEEALAASRNPSAARVTGSVDRSREPSERGSESVGRRLQRAVMTGVSYMIPFVAAGGLLLALGFLFGGYDMAYAYKDVVADYSLTNLPGQLWATGDGVVPAGTAGAELLSRSGFLLYIGAVLFAIGQAAMGFMIAVLSGYIAYALADRPGIAPGFVGGAIAVTVGAGFLGALVTGLLAGLLVGWMGTWRTPRWLSGLMPVVILPLVGSLVIGLLMFLLLGRPLAAVMTGLTDWLNGMSGSSVVLLGAILGLMMCADLGGPINKAAYTFATAGLVIDNPASLKIMAAVMAAGMVPPIAMSLATFARPVLFTPSERENGRAAWLLGLSFISEGAIPFAATDPLRVIPSSMLGGAVTGSLCMLFAVESYAPHGGIFVLFAISPWWGYLLAILAGVVVSTLAVVAAKSARRSAAPVVAADLDPAVTV